MRSQHSSLGWEYERAALPGPVSESVLSTSACFQRSGGCFLLKKLHLCPIRETRACRNPGIPTLFPNLRLRSSYMSAITLENIQKASAQFWEQMLNMSLEPCNETWGRGEVARCIEANHLLAHCDLSGVWVGRIE